MATTTGTPGDDTLDATPGDDSLIGLGGTDIALFTGNLADYTITSAGPWVLVTDTNPGDGDDGTEYLQGIEVLRFADGDVSLSITPNEFLVNTETESSQERSRLVALADGGYMIVWSSQLQDGDRNGVYAQRFDANDQPVGDEFQVNTLIDNDQALPTVTQLTNGNIVFTWNSDVIDDDQSGISGRIFDLGGTEVKGEFAVNATTTGDQSNAIVQALDGGGFVVVWETLTPFTYGGGTFTTFFGTLSAQIFDASGSPSGSEFQVTTVTDGNQSLSAVEAVSGGGFVVLFTDGLSILESVGGEFVFVEEGNGQDGSLEGAYLREFTANGTPVQTFPGQSGTAEFQLSDVSTGPQSNPDYAELSNGGFVAVWQSGAFFHTYDGIPIGGGGTPRVLARLFDTGGNVVVDSFLVSEVGGTQQVPTVAAIAGDRFVVVWNGSDPGTGSPSSDFGINMRIFANDGTAVTGNIVVNTTVDGSQTSPEVTALADGTFVVSWTSSDPVTNDRDVFAQRFDENGQAFGFATVTGSANADTLNGGAGDEILLGAGGNDVIDGGAGDDTLDGGADADSLSGGGGNDSLSGGDGDDTIGGGLGDDSLDGGAGVDTLAGDGGNDILAGGGDADSLDGGADADTLDGGAGNDTLAGGTGDDTILADDAGDDSVDGGLGTDVLEFGPPADPVGPGPAAGTSVTVDLGAGTFLDTHGGTNTVTGVENVAGTGFDDTLTGDGGANLIAGRGGDDTLSGSGGDDSLVGGDGTDVAVFAGGRASYRISNVGDAVAVTDDSPGVNGDDSTDRLAGVEVLRFADGDVAVATANDEFQVNQFTTHSQSMPAVATLNDGSLIVAWASGGSLNTQDGNSSGVFARRFDALGLALGDEFQVNTTTNSSQFSPAVAATADGGYVITWDSFLQDGDSRGLAGQRFAADDTAVGSEFLINTTTAGIQTASSVAALPGPAGGFVVAWESANLDGSDNGIALQRYDAAGTPAGEVQVNTFTTGTQEDAQVAANADGELLVVWVSDGQDGDDQGIFGQFFNPAGNPHGSEFQVNGISAEWQSDPAVTALADGTFAVAYATLASPDHGQGAATVVRRFDPDTGLALGPAVQANAHTSNNQFEPEITALADGGFVVVWESVLHPADNSRTGVFARRFGADGNPVGDEFQVNTFTSQQQEQVSVSALADGSLFFVWASGDDVGVHQDGSGRGIFGQVVSPENVLLHTLVLSGGGGNDVINGGDGRESLVGGGGNDTLSGLLEKDSLFGEDGNDTLTGGADDDYLDGGAGLDVLFGSAGVDLLIGGLDADSLFGGGDADSLLGGDGNDRLEGGGDADTIDGGGGADTLLGGDGADLLFGAAGNDDLRGGNHDDSLDGGDGDDTAFGGGGADSIAGGLGADRLFGDAGGDTLDGGEGADRVFGGVGNDSLVGGTGNDVLQGDGDNDTVDGGEGNDTLQGNDGDDSLIGGIGDDTLNGGGGADSVSGDAGADVVFAGTGADTVDGGDDGDRLFGDTGADVLLGGAGADSLFGGGDGDSLAGGDGDDTLAGGAGNDTLEGGAGADVAVFSGALADYVLAEDNGQLRITDAAPGTDGDDGSDLLSGIGTLRFADVDITVTEGPGGEFVVNTTTAGVQKQADVAALGNGTFVTVWSSFDGFDDGVYSQRFDASGNPIGDETLVNTYTFFRQEQADISPLTGGGYVVTWQSSFQDGNSFGVFGQRFADDGTPLGDEFRINTMTLSAQDEVSVSALSDGGFVASWTSATDGVGDIYLQRFDSLGGAVGTETLVNTHTTQEQADSSIVGLPGGGLVVTWMSAFQDGDSRGVYARVYDIDGGNNLVDVTGEFRVANVTTGTQHEPVITALAGGGFVVLWTDSNGDGSSNGIRGQIYDAAGVEVGGEFVANTYTIGSQTDATVTALADGGFVVTWEMSGLGDTSSGGLFGQRFDATGTAVGDLFQLNSTTLGLQNDAALAAAADGTLMAVWESDDQDGDGDAVIGLRIDADGQPLAPLTISGSPGADTLVGGDGGEVIAGLGGADLVTGGLGSDTLDGGDADDTVLGNAGNDRLAGGGGADVLDGGGDDDRLEGGGGADSLLGGLGNDLLDGGADADTADGGAGDDTLRGGLGNDSLAGGNDTDTLMGEDGDDALFGDAGTDSLEGGLGNDVLDGGADADTLWGQEDNDTLTGGLGSDTLDGGAGSDVLRGEDDNDVLFGGADADTVQGNAGDDSLDGGGGDDTLNAGSGLDSVFGGDGADVVFAGTEADIVDGGADGDRLFGDGGADMLIGGDGLDTLFGGADGDSLDGGADADSLFGDAGGDTLDGGGGGDTLDGGEGGDTLDGGDGGDTLIAGAGDDTLIGGGGIDVAVFDGPMADFTFTATPGGLVVTDGTMGPGPFATDDGADLVADVETLRFADGDLTVSTTPGGEFLIHDATTSSRSAPSAAALADGTFVAAWQGFGDGLGQGIFARRFDAVGNPLDDEVVVNTFTTLDQTVADVAALSDGGFFVTWQSNGQDGDSTGIFGQRFDAAGNPAGDEFQVNTTTADSQQASAAAGLADGGFVVTWNSSNSSDISEVFVQRYNANGDPVGGEFQANAFTTSGQVLPDVAGLAGSRFVVTWQSDGQDGSRDGVYGRVYDQMLDGTLVDVSGEIRLTGSTGGNQAAPSIAGRPDGGFVVAYFNNSGLAGRLFAADGAPLAAEFVIEPSDGMFVRGAPLVGVQADGGFTVVWDMLNGPGGNSWDTWTQRFDATGTAIGDAFIANQGTTGTQDDPALAVAGDGTLFVAWEQFDGSSTVEAIVLGPSNLPPPPVIVEGGADADTITGGDGSEELQGQGGDDVLVGGDGADVLDGGSGDDTLTGGAGDDVVDGGSGDDWIVGGSGAGDDTYTGGTDSDTVSYASTTAGVDVDLDAGTATGTQIGTDTLIGIENVVGGAGADTLTGDGADNTLDGGGGDDTLTGGGGEDFAVYGSTTAGVVVNLAGGSAVGAESGTDTLSGIEHAIGGAGSDTLIGDGGTNTLAGSGGDDTLDGAGGIDTACFCDDTAGVAVDLAAGAAIGAASGTDVLTAIENAVGGSGDDSIAGSSGINVLAGGGGSDTLRGFDGSDTLDGGDGADLLVGAAASDTLMGGAGADTLTGGDGNDVVEGGADGDVLEGNLGDDTLRGDGGSDTLFGLADNDDLDGGDEADVVFGGTGDDHVKGGAGNDFVYGQDDDDTVDGNGGDDNLFGGGGGDTLNGGAGDDIAFAHDGADSLSGGDDDDRLFGGTGNDVIAGDGGNDRLYGQDDNDTLLGGDGLDTLFGALGDDSLDGGGDADTLFGFDGLDSLAGGLGDDAVFGGTGDDTIDGGGGADNLQGQDGMDVIEGGAGNDVIAGGLGGDTLSGGDDADTVFGGQGADTLSGGSGADQLFGGGENDSVSGGDGADIVQGQDGADTLDGGADADTLLGGAGGDSLQGSAGTDTLFGDGGNDHLAGGTEADRLFGSTGSDLLEGNAGNDVLEGGADADTLSGGLGDDVLSGDAGNDIFVFAAATGSDVDRIRDFAVGSDALRLLGGLAVGTTAESDVNFDGTQDTTLTLSSGDRIELIGVNGLAGDPTSLLE